MSVVGILLGAGVAGAGIVGGLDLLRTGSLWNTLGAFSSIIVFVVGLLIALAIPVLANFVFEELKPAVLRVLMWMLAIIAAFVVLQIALHQLNGASLVHWFRETLREPLAPIRSFISPAQWLERVLPSAMGGTIWLIAFSSILTLISTTMAVREGRGYAQPLAALGILIGCSLLL